MKTFIPYFICDCEQRDKPRDILTQPPLDRSVCARAAAGEDGFLISCTKYCRENQGNREIMDYRRCNLT